MRIKRIWDGIIKFIRRYHLIWYCCVNDLYKPAFALTNNNTIKVRACKVVCEWEYVCMYQVKDSKTKRSLEDNLTIYNSKGFFSMVLNMNYHKIHAVLHEQHKYIHLNSRTIVHNFTKTCDKSQTFDQNTLTTVSVLSLNFCVRYSNRTSD